MIKKMNSKRYVLNISYPNIPSNIVLFNDNNIIKDKEFYTLQEIAEYLNISYAVARGIYKNTNKQAPNRFYPVITIKDIEILEEKKAPPKSALYRVWSMEEEARSMDRGEPFDLPTEFRTAGSGNW